MIYRNPGFRAMVIRNKYQKTSTIIANIKNSYLEKDNGVSQYNGVRQPHCTECGLCGGSTQTPHHSTIEQNRLNGLKSNANIQKTQPVGHETIEI